jgi:hypothetical protein
VAIGESTSSRISAESYEGLPRPSDPTVIGPLEIRVTAADMRAVQKMNGAATYIYVEGLDVSRVEGVYSLLRQNALRAGGQEKPTRFGQWVGLGSGLSLSVAAALGCLVTDAVPSGTPSSLLLGAGVVSSTRIGFVLGRRRAERGRTTIRLNNSVAVPAKQPWSRADKLAAGTLAVAFAGLLVAVRFGLVAHRDAQEPADKPTVSISRTL